MTGILQFVELFGTLVFAISGGLAAAEKKLDVFGFVVLAVATGIGGGTVRNIFLDVYPLVWAAEPIYLLICALAGIATFQRVFGLDQSGGALGFQPGASEYH